jgi:cell division protein ZapA
MGQVSVTINSRKYQIACEDGQEAHLTRLAGYVDKRVGELVAAVGQIGDARLLVMASLLIADELSDAYAELKSLRGPNGEGEQRRAEDEMGVRLDALARRIEAVAETLERA